MLGNTEKETFLKETCSMTNVYTTLHEHSLMKGKLKNVAFSGSGRAHISAKCKTFLKPLPKF